VADADTVAGAKITAPCPSERAMKREIAPFLDGDAVLSTLRVNLSVVDERRQLCQSRWRL